jgi:hypothetical protein
VLGTSAAAAAAPLRRPHIAFFNHGFAVLDAETADAIAHSDYLKTFGVFEVRTTTADGDTWTDRYLAGKQTYLEFFGPKDFQGAGPGDAGVAVSSDKAGGLAWIKAALIRRGVAHPDSARRTRKFGTDEIPWFDLVASPEEPQTFSVWAMEYVPSYFDDSRTGRERADYPGDISRERYQADTYADRRMRDVALVEIACPATDLEPALALFKAGGLSIRNGGDRVEASDGDTTIVLDVVAKDQAGLRRIVFALNAPADQPHVERIGHSSLIVGPGSHAVWMFPR